MSARSVIVTEGFTRESTDDGEVATLEGMLAMNVISKASITKAAPASIMVSVSGGIINIGAGSAMHAAVGMGAYAGSKAGMHRLNEALFTERAETVVTVNSILPSIFDPPANQAEMPGADHSKSGKPAALAEVTLYVASSAARSISGALIAVTRGQRIAPA